MKHLRWMFNKRLALILAATFAALGLLYWTLIPSVVARQYLNWLDKELSNTQSALHKVASTSSLPMYLDPDVPLAARQKQIEASIKDVDSARQSLAKLGDASRLAALPGSGFTGNYRRAQVTLDRTQSIQSQTDQILNQYSQLLTFLKDYTEKQIQLDIRLGTFNNLRTLNRLTVLNSGVATAAAETEEHWRALSTASVPPDFRQLREQASITFGRAATGFERLSYSAATYSQPGIDYAARQLETATIKNQVTDKALLVSLADKSPILRQLAELPEKVEFVQDQKQIP